MGKNKKKLRLRTGCRFLCNNRFPFSAGNGYFVCVRFLFATEDHISETMNGISSRMNAFVYAEFAEDVMMKASMKTPVSVEEYTDVSTCSSRRKMSIQPATVCTETVCAEKS
ncbi:MAG: hypothetical protein MJ052_04390 [Sphaerochaetaceae bacterium]|nr:hypothetical protein [Sphaerochaetaceae bacterium]